MTVSAIVAAVGKRLRVEIAGGLRTDASVAAVLDLGAARAVVGTAALHEPAFAQRLVQAHGADRIAVAIDVRDGVAVGRGWVADADGIDAAVAIGRLADAGVTTFEVTAIDRDGLLGGAGSGSLRATDRARIPTSSPQAVSPRIGTSRPSGNVGAPEPSSAVPFLTAHSMVIFSSKRSAVSRRPDPLPDVVELVPFDRHRRRAGQSAPVRALADEAGCRWRWRSWSRTATPVRTRESPSRTPSDEPRASRGRRWRPLAVLCSAGRE